jgi:hypothetical protein
VFLQCNCYYISLRNSFKIFLSECGKCACVSIISRHEKGWTRGSLRDRSKTEIRVCVSIRVSVGVRIRIRCRVRVRFSIVASGWLLNLLRFNDIS